MKTNAITNAAVFFPIFFQYIDSFLPAKLKWAQITNKYIGYLSPEQFRWSASLTLVGMAIVGGLSSVEGGILGSVLLTFLPELLRSADQLRMILYGLVIILSLAFIPNGLISLFGKSRAELAGMMRNRLKELTRHSTRKSGLTKHEKSKEET